MNRLLLPALLAAFSLATPALAAEDAKRSFSVGFDYSSGNYGGSSTTKILSIPLTGSYETGPWLFKLTLPYLRVTGPGDVVPGVGRQSDGSGGGAGGGAGQSTTTTESGLGDLAGAATYNLVPGSRDRPWIDITGKIKLGTANETRGLGTGEHDFSAQVDVYQAFGQITGFAHVGYSILGDSAALPLRNVFYGGAGGSLQFQPRVSGGLMLNMREATSAFSEEQLELTAFANLKLDDPWRLQGYVVRGLADGSPDWAIGAQVSRPF